MNDLDPSWLANGHASSEPISDDRRWDFERLQPWARALIAICGSKVSRNNWITWKRLCDEFTVDVVAKHAKLTPPTMRWPDAVEERCMAAGRNVPHPMALAEPPGMDQAMRARHPVMMQIAVAMLAAIDAKPEMIYASAASHVRLLRASVQRDDYRRGPALMIAWLAGNVPELAGFRLTKKES